jgi:hypothetical protein
MTVCRVVMPQTERMAPNVPVPLDVAAALAARAAPRLEPLPSEKG